MSCSALPCGPVPARVRWLVRETLCGTGPPFARRRCFRCFGAADTLPRCVQPLWLASAGYNRRPPALSVALASSLCPARPSRGTSAPSAGRDVFGGSGRVCPMGGVPWQRRLTIHSSRTHFVGRLNSVVRRQGDIMTVKRMDNVGIVVEDIDAAIEFFTELGLELEGRAPIEGDWADGVTGLRDMRVEIAMMRTPDGHGRLEISRFLAPPVVADHRSAPVNALGYLRVMFTVEDIDDTLARLGKRGAELVGEVVQYEDTYRLCYIRGPEGVLIGLAQELGQQTSR